MIQTQPDIRFVNSFLESDTIQARRLRETIVKLDKAAALKTANAPSAESCEEFSVLVNAASEGIVYVVFTGSAYSQTSFTKYLEDLRGVYETSKNAFVLVLDMRMLSIPPSLKYVFAQASFLQDNSAYIRERVRGTVLLCDHQSSEMHLLVQLIRLVFTIVPAQHPVTFAKITSFPFMGDWRVDSTV